MSCVSGTMHQRESILSSCFGRFSGQKNRPWSPGSREAGRPGGPEAAGSAPRPDSRGGSGRARWGVNARDPHYPERVVGVFRTYPVWGCRICSCVRWGVDTATDATSCSAANSGNYTRVARFGAAPVLPCQMWHRSQRAYWGHCGSAVPIDCGPSRAGEPGWGRNFRLQARLGGAGLAAGNLCEADPQRSSQTDVFMVFPQ
jgi:hypothetical protein